MQTLSQSSFDLVIGSARLRPLNVFSPISEYASLRVDWYLPSSVSISAMTLDAEAFAFVDVIAGGRLRETVWVVESCTYDYDE